MNKFAEKIKSGCILVADGATGTNLQKAGLKAGMHTEDWVMDFPEKILGLETAYVAAGSDIILTCTFGGNRLQMKGSKYENSAGEVNKRAVEIAFKAASTGSNIIVAGSMGPSGQLLKPYGTLDPDEASAVFREQAKILAENGVDLFVIETHFAIEEAEAALNGVRSVSDLPVVVSFSYDKGLRTMMGVSASQVAEKFVSLGVTAVGANCGTTLENMEILIREYRAADPDIIIWAKPNAGLPKAGNDGSAHYDISPEQMSKAALHNISAGARIVGGCCGSTPEHISEIAKAVKLNTL